MSAALSHSPRHGSNADTRDECRAWEVGAPATWLWVRAPGHRLEFFGDHGRSKSERHELILTISPSWFARLAESLWQVSRLGQGGRRIFAQIVSHRRCDRLSDWSRHHHVLAACWVMSKGSEKSSQVASDIPGSFGLSAQSLGAGVTVQSHDVDVHAEVAEEKGSQSDDGDSGGSAAAPSRGRPRV